MVEDIIGVFTLALILGVVALAIRNGTETGNLMSNTLKGFSTLEGTVIKG